MAQVEVGSAKSQRGKAVTGWIDAVSLPTGGFDRFPVIIAQGHEDDGPVMWITAGIHGGEHTGVIAAQQIIAPSLVSSMRGTLVIMPTLNPAGLRTRERSPYYYTGDPNRLFPEPGRSMQTIDSRSLQPGLEVAYQMVYKLIRDSGASLLLDLHCAHIGSLPMVFRDPVLFNRRRSGGMPQAEANRLNDRVGDMLDAFGFTIVNEFTTSAYLTNSLHRSVSGAVLNGLRIPAATVELGSWLHVDRGTIEACLSGIRNVMRWAGMLGGDLEPITTVPVFRPGYPVKRHSHPVAPHAGFVQYLAYPGDGVNKGQAVARMTDVFGHPIGNDNGYLRSNFDGFVLSWYMGSVRYQGDAIMMLAVPDDSDRVVPYPAR